MADDDDKKKTTKNDTGANTPAGNNEPPRGGRRGPRRRRGDGGDEFRRNFILAKLVINKESPGEREEDGLLTVVRHREILFCFSDKAAKRRLFFAPWRKDPRVHRNGIYIVTRKGVFKTSARAVAELLRQLPSHFLDAHQGLALNILRMKWIEYSGSGDNAVGFGVKRGQPKQSEEWLMLSRQCARDIKHLFECRFEDEDKKEDVPADPDEESGEDGGPDGLGGDDEGG